MIAARFAASYNFCVADAARIRIEGIYISPGHNFFGHHGRPAGTDQAVSVKEVECVAGQGLRGDRFFGFKENYKGQVTFIAAEVFAEVLEKVGARGKVPGDTRRNVVTRGVDLNSLVGRTFTIQGIEFEGVCECSPCEWMDRAVAPGAMVALQGRGGLRARILTSGMLRVDANEE